MYQRSNRVLLNTKPHVIGLNVAASESTVLLKQGCNLPGGGGGRPHSTSFAPNHSSHARGLSPPNRQKKKTTPRQSSYRKSRGPRSTSTGISSHSTHTYTSPATSCTRVASGSAAVPSFRARSRCSTGKRPMMAYLIMLRRRRRSGKPSALRMPRV
jgi:hypothetical protein